MWINQYDCYNKKPIIGSLRKTSFWWNNQQCRNYNRTSYIKIYTVFWIFNCDVFIIKKIKDWFDSILFDSNWHLRRKSKCRVFWLWNLPMPVFYFSFKLICKSAHTWFPSMFKYQANKFLSSINIKTFEWNRKCILRRRQSFEF